MANESNLDLDIDNYSINDLKKFFKLSDNDLPSDMKKKIDYISNKLLFSDSLKYNNNTKKEIFSFVNKAKDLIISEAPRVTNKMVSGAPHFVQDYISSPQSHVNQAKFNYKTKLIILNSIYSDSALTSEEINTFTFTLPQSIKNVMGLTLAALQYPNVELAFSDYKGNNLMFLQENYVNVNANDAVYEATTKINYSTTINASSTGSVIFIENSTNGYFNVGSYIKIVNPVDYTSSFFKVNAVDSISPFTLTILNLTASNVYIQAGSNVTLVNSSGETPLPTTEPGDGKSVTIRLPDGTYSVYVFPDELQKQINLALGYPTEGVDGPTTSIFTLPRYYVSINPNSHQTTITNNLDPLNTRYPLALEYSKNLHNNNNFFANFTLVFDKPTWTSNSSRVCVPGSQNNPPDPNFRTLTEGYENNNLQYRSLGYQMGFRKIVNMNKTSYTSVSIYNSDIVNYVYFSLEDYVTTRVDEINGIFFDSVFDKNILALVPITAQPFTSNLDSGANFIFKTRNFAGPVDLKKFTVSFYDPNGFQTHLNGTPFTFSLELKIVYENPILLDAVGGLEVGFSESGI